MQMQSRNTGKKEARKHAEIRRSTNLGQDDNSRRGLRFQYKDAIMVEQPSRHKLMFFPQGLCLHLNECIGANPASIKKGCLLIVVGNSEAQCLTDYFLSNPTVS
ncbi:MAG: hypothetical protein JWL77_564 [Chthonomonadaceae bacterium]|nr:hypothetical protein [Chthonomonadaceae bacterium]